MSAVAAIAFGVAMLVAGIAIGFRNARAHQMLDARIAADTRDALVDDAADRAADDEELAVEL